MRCSSAGKSNAPSTQDDELAIYDDVAEAGDGFGDFGEADGEVGASPGL